MSTKLTASDGGKGYATLVSGYTCARILRCLRIVLSRSAAVRVLLPVIFALTVAKEILGYFIGTLTAEFYPILAKQDQDGFFTLLAKGVVIVLSMSALITAQNYILKLTQIHWRRAFTREIHKRYFSDRNFYKVNCTEPGVSNPDQRITQDISELCVSFCDTFPTLFISPLSIGYYAYQSVTITGSILSPLIVITFALLCSIMSKVFMAPIVHRTVEQQRREALFRKQHLDVAGNAENIAFIDGAERVEHMHSDTLITELTQTQHSVALRYIALDMTLQSSAYLYSLLAFVITAIPVFAGDYKNSSEADLSGIISKNVFITIYLASCFTRLLDVFKDLVTVEAMVLRITALLDAMSSGGEPEPIVESTDPPKFILEDVSFETPTGDRTLVANLTLELACGRNVLITGPSNVGKTSLFRVIRGLWIAALGRVRRQGDLRQAMFVTPRPFLGSSCETIRKTVGYPNVIGSAGDDKEVYRYLQLLRLRHLLTAELDLDAPLSDGFLEGLSPGEQQRLVLCRILLSKPRLVLVDEAFNSLDHAVVSIFFDECRRLNITVTTISHHAELLSPYHDMLLRLHQGGNWELRPLDDSGAVASPCEVIEEVKEFSPRP